MVIYLMKSYRYLNMADLVITDSWVSLEPEGDCDEPAGEWYEPSPEMNKFISAKGGVTTYRAVNIGE